MSMTKRMIAMFLIFVTLSSVMVVAVSADNGLTGSNARINTFLKMAAGAEITDEDVSGLTMDQLQFLGIYLSNFFVPFGTEFGGNNDEIAETCREDMIEALQTRLAFSDEMAEALVETVLQMTRDSVQYLDVYVKENGGTMKKAGLIAPNYYNFFRLMTGNTEDVIGGYFNGSPISYYYGTGDYAEFVGLTEYTEMNKNDDTGIDYWNMITSKNCPGGDIDDKHMYGVNYSDFESYLLRETPVWCNNGARANLFGLSEYDSGVYDSCRTHINYYNSSTIYAKNPGVNGWAELNRSAQSPYIPLSSSIFPNSSSAVSDIDFFLSAYKVYTYLSEKSLKYKIPCPFCKDDADSIPPRIVGITPGDDQMSFTVTFYSYVEGGYEDSEDRNGAYLFSINESNKAIGGFYDTGYGAGTLQDAEKTGNVEVLSNGGIVTKMSAYSIIVDKGLWESAEVIAGILDGKYNTLYFGYEKDGTVFPMFDCVTSYYLNKSPDYNRTASQMEFLKCLEQVNMEVGYGVNLLDFNNTDSETGEWEKDDIDCIAKYFSDKSIYTDEEVNLRATAWGQRMATDCFGNIIVMGSLHQYIAVPGCMNPYVWQAVNKNGDDVGPAGAFMNIVNAKNLVQADNGLIDEVFVSKYLPPVTPINGSVLFSSEDTLHLVCKISTFGDDLHPQIGDYFNALTVNGDANMAARFVRGANQYRFKCGWWIFTADDDSTRDAIKKVGGTFKKIYKNDKTGCPTYQLESDSWFGGSEEEFVVIYKGTKKGGPDLSKQCTVNLLDGFVYVDNLGVYKNPDGSSNDFHAFNFEHYLDPSTGTSSGSIARGLSNSDFGSKMQQLVSGALAIPKSASAQALSSIYVSYVYAYFYTDENKEDTIGKLGYRIAKESLPACPSGGINIDLESITVDYQLNAIKDWTYYLLHPTKGFNYVKILITNKLNHLLLGWHSDMVGTNGVGVTTGTTKYRSTVGYVTMPDLSEIEWTDRLIGFYQDCIPFLIILIVVLMLFAFITGVLSLQRAILAAVLFSLFLMLPTTLINGAVQQSNLISQKIYGDKFVYWAMIQQETYAKQIDEAANMEGSSGDSSYSNYLRTLYGTNQDVYSNQGSESIVLKWQAPKKMASLVLSSADQKSLIGLGDVGRSMLYGMLGRSYGGQSYVDDEDAVYMYRSYLDISNFSRYIYRGIHTNENSGGPYVKSNDEAMDVSKAIKGTGGTLMFSDALSNAVSNMEDSFDQYRKDGYTTYSNGESSTNHSMSYVTVPMSSRVVADALKGKGSLSDFDDVNDLININQDLFNFGIPMFTNSTVSLKDVKTYAATGNIVEGTTRYTALSNSLSKYTEEDMTGLAAYALYSENVFYYYSWKLYNDGLNYKSSLSGGNGYKDLLLGKNDGGYFYMNEGNGGLRDFMDMRSLFTYIIPYMRECNELVREWDDTYGIFIYDGVPTEEGCWNEIGSDPELRAKYWHNLNVSRLYCIYCPWVDVMYDCSYAEPETITVLGSRYVVSDPLNPASYPADRPMIFSEAEMEDYGLSEGDLTAAERKILQCNEEMQERMYELLNYYNFSDITLDTAAAMQCAFTFNSVFSETGIMKENHNIYPQSYDLANFSYDAFLRMILSNSTGESMLNTSKSVNTAAGETSGDFYERVVNNSSTTTVIVMLILDVLSIYVLPAFKMFFLVAAFLASVLIVFVSLCKIEDNAKFLRKITSGFLLPLLKFFVITIVFSWVISLFMGTGNNSITQTNELSISLGDPVMVMLVMIAIDILVLYLYWKIIKGVLKDVKFNGKMALGFAGGVIGAVGGLAVGAVAGATHAASSTADAAGRGIRRAQDRRYQKKVVKGLEGSDGVGGGEPPAQNGTGVESDRAAQRAAENRNAAAGGESTPRPSNAGVGSGSSTPKVRQPVKSAEDKASDKAKTEAINNKAMSGTQKLREKQRQAEEQRYDRYRQSAERDFGYARGEDGKIDPSKLNAKDRYKYDQRMKRTANRERAQSKADNEALKAQYRKEYGGKSKGKSDSSKPKEDKKSDNKNK